MKKVLLPTSYPWLVTIAVAVILSLFEVTKNAEGAYIVNFRVTIATVVLLALFWLPFLLKVIALSGGGLKTSAGEANILGLEQLLSRLDTDTRREALSTYVAVVEAAESKSPESDQTRLREIRKELENQLASLSPKSQQARMQVETLSQLYESMREKMPSSPERTFKMSTIVAQARSIANEANYTTADLANLFREGSDGTRIVVLGILQQKPDPSLFSLVLEGIGKSRSAFEQYQALQVAGHMLPTLNTEQKRQLVETIMDQRSGGPGKYITPDSDRWRVSDRLLDAIDYS
jgi:hypothetical protein